MPFAPIRANLSRGCAALLLLLTLFFAAQPVRASLFQFEGPLPADLGVRNGALAACASTAHCSRRDWATADPTAALGALLPSVLRLDGIAIVETGNGYLHATATSRLFGFVDDLELFADTNHQTLQARSASRLGDSDLGVNARRLDTLQQALKAT